MQINDSFSAKSTVLTKSNNDKSKLSWEKEYWDKQLMQSIEAKEKNYSEKPDIEDWANRDAYQSLPVEVSIEAKSMNCDQNVEKKNSFKSILISDKEPARSVRQYQASSIYFIGSGSNKLVDIKFSGNGVKVYQNLNFAVNQALTLKKHLILEKDNKARVFTSQGDQTFSYRQILSEALSFFGLKLQTLIVRGKDI